MLAPRCTGDTYFSPILQAVLPIPRLEALVKSRGRSKLFLYLRSDPCGAVENKRTYPNRQGFVGGVVREENTMETECKVLSYMGSMPQRGFDLECPGGIN